MNSIESLFCERFPGLLWSPHAKNPPYLPPLPVSESAVQTITAEHRDAGLQIQSCTTDTGVLAKPIPNVIISSSVDSTELAGSTALHLCASPEARVDAVADALLRTFPDDISSSYRVS